MRIERTDITGLILTAGFGTFRGGVDPGLQNHLGMPLALYATLRLAPQVGEVMINANHNLAAYESMGVPVWPDASPDGAGLLTGWLTGLEHCITPYMLTVPCDAPDFPGDLVARLADALGGASAEIAIAATREANAIRVQPMFCLMNAALLESLAEFLRGGQTEVSRWTSRHRCVEVLFEDASAFVASPKTSQGQQVRSSSIG